MKKNNFKKSMTAQEYQQHINSNLSEHEIQAGYFKVLEANEKKYPELKYIFAIPNGAKVPYTRSKKGKVISPERIKLVAEGMKRGVPDIFIPIITKYRFGAGINDVVTCSGKFLETKTEKGTLSAFQKEYKKFLIEQGYEYALCRSVQELISETENYLNIKLT